MKCFLRALRRAAPFAMLAAAIVCVSICPVRVADGEEACIVSIWNVDTFEGGKGSRASFLQRVARLCEGDGTFFRVVSYTAEGARTALGKGERPDVLSFGIGLGERSGAFLPLGRTFAGSSRALPWCAGEYLLFSLKDDFEEEGSTVISSGGRNLSYAAAFFSDIEGEELPSLDAYLAFLAGKYRYLLGTQRDVCRFAARGATVYTRSLPAYNDLFQYVGILSEEHADACRRFVETLLSDDVQTSLREIGMRSANGMSGLTADVFSSDEAIDGALRALRGGSDEKNPKKFFKSI